MSEPEKDSWQSKACAQKLAALAAPDRLRIVEFLRAGPHSVTDIAEMLKEPLVNVSHHLMVLRHAGLVCNERKGRFILYSLPPEVFNRDEGPVGQEHIDLGCCRIELNRPDEPEK